MLSGRFWTEELKLGGGRDSDGEDWRGTRMGEGDWNRLDRREGRFSDLYNRTVETKLPAYTHPPPTCCYHVDITYNHVFSPRWVPVVSFIFGWVSFFRGCISVRNKFLCLTLSSVSDIRLCPKWGFPNAKYVDQGQKPLKSLKYLINTI